MTATSNYVLPFPPSINGYWRAFRGRNILSKKGREYREQALNSIGKVKSVLTGRLSVNLALFPPCRRRRDVDNYAKGVLDAFTHAGVWEDDSQIEKLIVTKHPKDGNPRVEVTIEELGSV